MAALLHFIITIIIISRRGKNSARDRTVRCTLLWLASILFFTMKLSFTLLVVVALHIAVCVGYRPVIVMHGILSDAADQKQLVNMIQQAHQGTEVLNLDLYNDLDSIFADLWTQVDGVYAKMEPFMKASEDGVNLVCFSQGMLKNKTPHCNNLVKTN